MQTFTLRMALKLTRMVNFFVSDDIEFFWIVNGARFLTTSQVGLPPRVLWFDFVNGIIVNWVNLRDLAICKLWVKVVSVSLGAAVQLVAYLLAIVLLVVLSRQLLLILNHVVVVIEKQFYALILECTVADLNGVILISPVQNLLEQKFKFIVVIYLFVCLGLERLWCLVRQQKQNELLQLDRFRQTVVADEIIFVFADLGLMLQLSNLTWWVGIFLDVIWLRTTQWTSFKAIGFIHFLLVVFLCFFVSTFCLILCLLRILWSAIILGQLLILSWASLTLWRLCEVLVKSVGMAEVFTLLDLEHKTPVLT